MHIWTMDLQLWNNERKYNDTSKLGVGCQSKVAELQETPFRLWSVEMVSTEIVWGTFHIGNIAIFSK